jgi:hypothetical protein
MNITPKNIYKGRNSDGSTFRVEEWDFATLSNMELGSFVITFIVCMALVSIISPILAILGVLAFSGRFNLMYVLSIIFGAYFWYDCLHGWMGVLCLSFFASESTINLFLRLNIVSIVVSSVLLIFGKAIANVVTDPITKYGEDGYLLLSSNEQQAAEDSVNRNKVFFYLFIALVIVGSFVISSKFVPKQKGWVKQNVEYVSPQEKEEARQDSLKKALGGFNSQNERDAHFKEMERKWGN